LTRSTTGGLAGGVAAENLFRGIFESGLAGYAVADLTTGALIAINDRLLEIIGYSREAAENTQNLWLEVTPPEHVQLDERAIRQVLDVGAADPFEKEYIRRDGTRVPVRIASALVPGSTAQVIIQVEDITERRRSDALMRAREQALRESDARLRLAVEAGRMAVWDYDTRTEIIRTSPELNRLLGYPPDAALQLDEIRTRYFPGERERLAAVAAAALEQGDRFFEIEYRFYRLDGALRWFLLRAELELAPEGQPVRVVGVVLDITDRKRTEEELADRQAELNAALDAGALAVADYDHRTGLFRPSPRLNEFYGYPRDRQLTIADVRARYHPEAVAEILARVERDAVAAGENKFDWTLRLLLPDGSTRWVQGLGEYIRDSDGTILRSRGVVMDVTERRRAEEHQRLLINELNHRVKNSLAIVQGLAQQSFKGDATTQAARQAFEARLAALAATHDLLTQEAWQSASLRRVVEEVIAPYCSGREQFAVDGPDLALAPKVAVSLALGLHELCTNAAKYGALSVPEGSVRVRWSAAGNGRLALEWRETGGPAVHPPARRGFGTRMIEKGLASELRGKVEIAFCPSGVVCTIEAELPEPGEAGR
jgi:PAS domain S-box-containing protein